ncbi:MAG: porin family protein, partial [Acidobacteriota bacterium]|nr:porin family protein [Acidobacteriota bacterium]
MRTVLPVAGLVLCLSLPAFAQNTTPAVDISGGYSFLRDQDLEENLHGWVASIAGNVTRWLGLIGEVGGNYKSMDVFGTDVDFSVHSFMGGARFSARSAGNVTPFGQVLVGGVRGSVSALGESESTTEFGLQFGGGADFWLRPKFGIRVGGDYRRVFVEE